jgi:hypothetical protein
MSTSKAREIDGMHLVLMFVATGAMILAAVNYVSAQDAKATVRDLRNVAIRATVTGLVQTSAVAEDWHQKAWAMNQDLPEEARKKYGVLAPLPWPKADLRDLDSEMPQTPNMKFEQENISLEAFGVLSRLRSKSPPPPGH